MPYRANPFITGLLLLVPAGFLLFSGCKVQDYNSDSQPVDHRLWDSLLQAHVSGAGWVDYPGFIQDSVRLNEYLTLLKNNHPNKKNWDRNERMAYWINAYNAFTVKLIVDHYPVQSIKDIKNGIPFVNTVWDIKFIEIEEAVYDLNNIEHGILRPKFQDPRIHFAVNCASVSCPKLWNRAYTAEGLDEQLDRAARDFLRDERRNVIAEDRVQLSKIFSWYGMDFKKKGKKLIEYLNQYSPVQIQPDVEVDYLEYNWNLNEEENA
jgi:hypothetical protein